MSKFFNMIFLSIVMMCSFSVWSMPSIGDVQKQMIRGNWQQANSMLDVVIEQKNDSAVAHYLRAQVRARLGDHTGSCYDWTTAKNLKDPSTYVTNGSNVPNELNASCNTTSAHTIPPSVQVKSVPQHKESSMNVFPIVMIVVICLVGIGFLIYFLNRKPENVIIHETVSSGSSGNDYGNYPRRAEPRMPSTSISDGYERRTRSTYTPPVPQFNPAPTPNVTNVYQAPNVRSGGMSMGEEIVAVAAGSALGSVIGNEINHALHSDDRHTSSSHSYEDHSDVDVSASKGWDDTYEPDTQDYDIGHSTYEAPSSSYEPEPTIDTSTSTSWESSTYEPEPTRYESPSYSNDYSSGSDYSSSYSTDSSTNNDW